MSMGSSPFQGGGAASIADATETTAGKIRIATSTEAETGTNDLTAMTPLTVKERIDAALVGGVEYKGTFNATTGLTNLGGNLNNAEKGDLYKIDTAGTIYGQTWAVNDNLLINANMGGSIDNSKIDKVDNTDAVTSVNTQTGAVVLSANDLAADHTAQNYTAANANIDGHLEGIDDEFALTAPLASPALTGTPTAPTATRGTNTTQIATTAFVTTAVAGAGGISSVSEDSAPALGGNLTTGTYNISGHLRPDGIRDLGSTTAEWRNLYLRDNGKIIWGDDQDVELIHDPDDGLILDLTGRDGSNDPQFRLTSQTDGSSSPRLSFHSESSSPASGDRVGQVLFEGKDSAANAQVYGLIRGQITDPTSTAESGKISLLAYPSYVNGKGLHVEGIANEAGGAKVNIDHNGSTYGLALNGTLVTSTAAELNILDGATVNTTELNLLDGGTSVGSSITIADTDGFFINDNGVSRLIPASDLKTYAASGASGISSVVEDTTPQLGGDLDVNGQTITSASNGDVTLDPNGTGDVVLGADLMPDADATHYIGDENTRFISAYTNINGAVQFKAKNDQGSAISKGQAVYLKGVSGTVPTIGLARANSASTMPAYGLALTDANDQAEVQIVTFGNLTDYDTTTYSLSVGNTVFVAADTAGGLTNSAPAGEANLIQNIGRVVRADASAGVIKVGGAGRSNATPNLDQNKIFLGNASNQAVSTALSAIDVSAFNDDGTYLKNLSEDSSPQLGANLDLNSYDLVTTSNADLDLAPNGTGVVVIRGNTNSGALKLNCENNSHGVTIQGPPHSAAATYTLTLPNDDGDPNQVLKTDGSGGLSWVDQPSASGGMTYSAITADPANAQAGYHYSCTGTFTITLATSGYSAGDEIRVKNMGTGTITIDPQTGTIDGSATDYTLDVQYSAITLVSTGSNWEII